jgi:hypothetical protein
MKIKFIMVAAMKHLIFLAASACLALVACASAPAPAAAPTSSPTTTAAQTARPSCDAIDEACDPHEDKGGLAKECHDLAEATATPEATCAARKAECLAACPK